MNKLKPGISGPYNLWTPVKNNIPYVWNWNLDLVWFRNWSGVGGGEGRCMAPCLQVTTPYHWLWSWCLWMKTKDMTKEFPSVLQYWQYQRNLISSLIKVPIGNDMRELDVKSCSQLGTVETVKIMFIIHCYAQCLVAIHGHWFDYGFDYGFGHVHLFSFSWSRYYLGYVGLFSMYHVFSITH